MTAIPATSWQQWRCEQMDRLTSVYERWGIVGTAGKESQKTCIVNGHRYADISAAAAATGICATALARAAQGDGWTHYWPRGTRHTPENRRRVWARYADPCNPKGGAV